MTPRIGWYLTYLMINYVNCMIELRDKALWQGCKGNH